jgi:pimeloyl-ACP methyl ester carboxylesterase
LTPLYFNDCFAWLHPARGGRGVVICSAFGVEELCMHRFMRHMADELSAAGMPTLRFDYHATGDSRGTEEDPDCVQQWLLNIKQAVECLKCEAGVSEVALVGLRLGSLLATHAAQKIDGVTMLALLAPVVSGKSHIREMKVLGKLIEQASGAVDADQEVLQINGIEVAGFKLTDQTIDSLQQLDLLQVKEPPARRVLIMGRRDGAAESRLAGYFREVGCTVEQVEFPGLTDFIWDTSFATLPAGAFTAAVQWMAQDLPPAGDIAALGRLSTLVDPDWLEDPVQFGPNQHLFGIRCRPVDSNMKYRRGCALLFVNHGSNHHIGWARLHVKLSRRFAALGLTSLRMDISGVGDSPARAGYAENLLYARHSQSDVYAALDWLEQQGYRDVTVIGHCAGAYLGFYATVRDARVKGLVMLNLQRFFWARGDSLEVATRRSFRSTGWYRSMLVDPQVWRRLLSARVNVIGIAKALARRAWQRSASKLVHFIGPLIGKEGLSRKVVRWLGELSARGSRVLLVYSAEDGGLDEVAVHAGAGGRKLRKLPNIEFRTVDGADHNMTSSSAQERYALILQEFLFRD